LAAAANALNQDESFNQFEGRADSDFDLGDDEEGLTQTSTSAMTRKETYPTSTSAMTKGKKLSPTLGLGDDESLGFGQSRP
jgi:hypothetical protein